MDQRPYPEPTVIAYTAGILDGEGWISRRLDRPRIGACSQSDGNGGRALCEWLREQWGGLGHVRKQRSSYGDAWLWHIDRLNDIRWFLVGVLPYLHVKRERAEALLGDLDRFTGGRSRGRWTPEEDAVIRQHWKKRDGEIALILGNGRSANAVTLRRRVLGISKPLNGFPRSERGA